MEYEGYGFSLQLERIEKTWAQREHSQLAHTLTIEHPPLAVPIAKKTNKALIALNVEDSSSPDLYAEVIVLDSSDIPPVSKAQGSDNGLSQDLNLAKLTLKDGSLTPLSSDKASTIVIVDDSFSTTFEDVSSTPPDIGSILDRRDLCAEDSIGHDVNIKVKRLDEPKVKCAPGSNLVKLPLKDDSLTPLSYYEKLWLQHVRHMQAEVQSGIGLQLKLNALIASARLLYPRLGA